MRGLNVAILGVALCGGLAAQTPPAGARDITQMPATTATAEAPSTVVSAPASVLRVYVDSLTGTDATAIAGLITQSLFDSKQVVITESQTNASLILRGSIEREPIPQTQTASRRSRSRANAARATAGISTDGAAPPPGLDMPVTELPSVTDTLGTMGAPTDMTQYRYRLNLQLVNPDGDLIWMSGQGRQALPFQDADDAVQQTLQPMMGVVGQLTAGRAH